MGSVYTINMELVKIPEHQTIEDAAEELAVENPNTEIRFLVTDDIVIETDLYNFNNVSFVGSDDESVPTIVMEGKLRGSNVEFREVKISSDRRSSNLGPSSPDSIIVDGLNIEKCFFDGVILYDCNYMKVSNSTGKSLTIRNSDNIRLDNVKFTESRYEEGASLEIQDCSSLVAEDITFTAERCPNCILLEETEDSLFRGVEIQDASQAIYINSCSDLTLNNWCIHNCDKVMKFSGKSQVLLENVSLDDNEFTIDSDDFDNNDIELVECPDIVATQI